MPEIVVENDELSSVCADPWKKQQIFKTSMRTHVGIGLLVLLVRSRQGPLNLQLTSHCHALCSWLGEGQAGLLWHGTKPRPLLKKPRRPQFFRLVTVLRRRLRNLLEVHLSVDGLQKEIQWRIVPVCLLPAARHHSLCDVGTAVGVLTRE